MRRLARGAVVLCAVAFPATLVELEKDDQRDVAIRIRRSVQTLETVNVTEESAYGKTDVAWRELVGESAGVEFRVGCGARSEASPRSRWNAARAAYAGRLQTGNGRNASGVVRRPAQGRAITRWA